MFQLFHADVAKVDRDVAYVAAVAHVCCKRLFSVFYQFFLYTYVESVSDVCLNCFICVFFMLQVLHQNVSKVDWDIAHVTMVFKLYVPNVYLF
jgi:hypothetical protein